MFGGVEWWVALILVPHCLGRATIENNGYQDVLVAISPEVREKMRKKLFCITSLQEAEDPALVDRIKSLLTDASAELYGATR